MIIDGLWQFSGTAGTPGSPTTGTQFSTNVVDLGPGARDLGIADDPAAKLSATVITTFTGGTSLRVDLQGSVDNTTFTTMVLGPVIAEANLIAGTHLFDVDLSRVVGPLMDKVGASQALPR